MSVAIAVEACWRVWKFRMDWHHSSRHRR
jgi:hypothetical protein